MGFGKKLKEKMVQKGIKQAELSKAANISSSTLSNIFARDNTRIDIEAFLRICKALDCRPEEFSDDIKLIENASLDSLTLNEQDVINCYRKLSDKEKAMCYDVLVRLSR